jgi:hypothetical protein
MGIGLAFEVVLAALLTVTLIRDKRAPADAALAVLAARLRAVLKFTLGGGLIAVAVLLLIDAHLHLFSKSRPTPVVQQNVHPPSYPAHSLAPSSGGGSFPLSAVLYGLLIAALVAATVLSVLWALRHRPVAAAPLDGDLIEDEADLREAVESGRTALRELDDARAAIIACYVAMERSLAGAGAARAAADTPDELLARATASGLVRGTAARRLTTLFYEARFSSHPLERGQRDAALQALDELADDLRKPVESTAETAS